MSPPRSPRPRDQILDLVQSDELVELTLGLRQQDGFALLGAGVDEVTGLGLDPAARPRGRCGRRCGRTLVGTIPKLESVSASST